MESAQDGGTTLSADKSSWLQRPTITELIDEILRLKYASEVPHSTFAAFLKDQGYINRKDLMGEIAGLNTLSYSELRFVFESVRAATEKARFKESPAQRQERRYQMCVDAGLPMPDNQFRTLPKGIRELAAREGISRQAFAQDVKAHIGKLHSS